jgi:hypothetical protein
MVPTDVRDDAVTPEPNVEAESTVFPSILKAEPVGSSSAEEVAVIAVEAVVPPGAVTIISAFEPLTESVQFSVARPRIVMGLPATKPVAPYPVNMIDPTTSPDCTAVGLAAVPLVILEMYDP